MDFTNDLADFMAATIEKKQGEQLAAQADVIKLFYDFEKFPPLVARFLGPGPAVPMGGAGTVIQTWKFADEQGYEWLVPRWRMLSVPVDNFLGFDNEPADGMAVFQINYQGKRNVPGTTNFIHAVTVFKKLVE